MRASRVILAMTAILAVTASAKDRDRSFPLRARVLSVDVQATHTRGTLGTAGAVPVHATSVSRETSVQIGDVVYTSTWTCRGVTATQEYPARIVSKRKLLSRSWDQIELDRGDGKVCELPIAGSHSRE